MGMMILAAVCRAIDFRNIKILDEVPNYILELELKKAKDSVLVGFTTTLFNYPECLRLASLVKQQGADTILGGPYVSLISNNCINKRTYIDYICVGEGETCISELIKGTNIRFIPNLVSRRNQKKGNDDSNQINTKVIINEHQINDLPILTRNTDYVKSFYKKIRRINPKQNLDFFPIMTHKGCNWRIKKGCIYCSLTSKRVQFINPNKLWNSINHYFHEYGVFTFRDIGDNIGMNLDWLRSVVKAKPLNMENCKFLVYCRADDLLKPGIANTLIDFNTYAIYVGFESGSNSSLKSLIKGYSQKVNVKALNKIKEMGFKIYTSFVIGAPGESDESINETIDFINQIKLVMGEDLIMLGVNILIPYPGTPAFAMLNQKYPNYCKEDILDPFELTKNWVELFCNFSGDKRGWHDHLLSISRELNTKAQSAVSLLGDKLGVH